MKHKSLNTIRITSLFGIDYPIIQAGMIWASCWELASTVSNAGGLGAMMSGEITVNTGDELQVLVGGQAPAINDAAGGGGGSFVVTSDKTFACNIFY